VKLLHSNAKILVCYKFWRAHFLKLHFPKRRKCCCSFGWEALLKVWEWTTLKKSSCNKMSSNCKPRCTICYYNITNFLQYHWNFLIKAFTPGAFDQRLLIYNTGVIVKDIWDFFSGIIDWHHKISKACWRLSWFDAFAAGHTEHLHVASTGGKISDRVWSSYPQAKGGGLLHQKH